jgi:hypothetical protein
MADSSAHACIATCSCFAGAAIMKPTVPSSPGRMEGAPDLVRTLSLLDVFIACVSVLVFSVLLLSCCCYSVVALALRAL